MWGRGVCDLQPIARSGMVAGRLLRHALHAAIHLIREIPCEHKVGMCRCPYDRFNYYQEDDSRWSPWLLALLASTTTREGAYMMEASLILQLEEKAINIENNRNWTVSMDYGGEGNRKSDDEANANDRFYVYLAVKPLPMRLEDEIKYFCESAAAEWMSPSAHRHIDAAVRSGGG